MARLAEERRRVVVRIHSACIEMVFTRFKQGWATTAVVITMLLQAQLFTSNSIWLLQSHRSALQMTVTTVGVIHHCRDLSASNPSALDRQRWCRFQVAGHERRQPRLRQQPGWPPSCALRDRAPCIYLNGHARPQLGPMALAATGRRGMLWDHRFTPNSVCPAEVQPPYRSKPTRRRVVGPSRPTRCITL